MSKYNSHSKTFYTNLVSGIYLDGCILPGVPPREKRKPEKGEYHIWTPTRLHYYVDVDKVYKMSYNKSRLKHDYYGGGVEIDPQDIENRAAISAALAELGDRWLGRTNKNVA